MWKGMSKCGNRLIVFSVDLMAAVCLKVTPYLLWGFHRAFLTMAAICGDKYQTFFWVAFKKKNKSCIALTETPLK